MQRDHAPSAGAAAVEHALDCQPVAADRALVMVDCDEQLPAWRDWPCREIQGLPHVAGMMQNAPGIDDVERA